MTLDSENILQFQSLHIRTSNEINGNFIRLPGHIVQTLENTGIAIQEFGIALIRSDSKLLHVGWDGYESQSYMSGQSTIEISPVLAQSFGCPVGSTVDLAISRYDSTKIAEEVYVQPETSDDWEIIESHSQFFQDEILHQTRIVALDEILYCYVDNVTCRFKIQKIVPESLRSARIDTGSLIVVAPRVAASRTQKNQSHSKALPMNSSIEPPNPIKIASKRSLFMVAETDDRGFRINLNPAEVTSQVAFVSILHNSLDAKHQGKHDKQEKGLRIAKKLAVAVEGSEDIPEGHVAMSTMVWDALWFQRQNGCRVVIEFLDDEDHDRSPSQITAVIRPFTQNDELKRASKADKQKPKAAHEEKAVSQSVEDVIERLKAGPLTDKTALFQERLFLEIIDTNTGRNIPCVAYVPTKELRWTFKSTPEAKISTSSFIQHHGDLDLTKSYEFLPSEVTKQITEYLLMPVISSSGVVLTAGSGMGKSTVLKELALELTSKHQRYVSYTDCDTLSDTSNMGKMKQYMQEVCSLCYWHRPSIILFDNADTLFPSNKTDDPQQQALQQNGGSTAAKLALYLISLVEAISKKSSGAIRVVFTAPDKSHLNNLLYDKHFISESFKKRPPNVDERGELIEFFFENLNAKLQLSDEIQYRDIALDTDCYSPLDLQIFVDKLFHQSITKMTPESDAITLDKKTYTEVLKNFSPTSLRGVKLTRSTGVVWNSIGALKGPKRVLLETLEWPTKYAPIFRNCPLQLRSGILLYGYPGCGKTMLASAVAQQCGLNFITVNGPEILNKYIGASEQNVRELFERAQSVKPCILFFDEFDSIAPKRGHDSTGVTDRIVNQLLTQMDGVEGLDGVYVLCATSRPDLIDSALLRPGRIDKSVLCNIPDYDDRLDILHTLTSTGEIHVVPGTDLSAVASHTAGYSGADLQGLCYNAYLKSVHRALQSRDSLSATRSKNPLLEYSVINSNGTTAVPQLLDEDQDRQIKETSKSSNSITINLQDLLDACQETKPSISASEYRKLQSIYLKFQNDRQGDVATDDNSTDVGTRISLM